MTTWGKKGGTMRENGGCERKGNWAERTTDGASGKSEVWSRVDVGN